MIHAQVHLHSIKAICIHENGGPEVLQPIEGLTAAVVIHRCYAPEPGDKVLIHAAASGVGNLLAQWTAHLGAAVNYGTASGPVPPVTVMLLAQRGSLSLYRPGFGFWGAKPATRQPACDELFDLLRNGAIKATISHRFALAEAAEAHQAIEQGKSMGSVLLVP